MRVFEQAGGVRVVQGAVGIAQNAWDPASGGVDHDQGSQLAAGDDVIADRDLVADQVLADALVDALVATAEQRQAAGLVGSGLSRRRPARGRRIG